MLKSALGRTFCWAVSCIFTVNGWADTFSAEQRLEAIRKNLVEATIEGPLEVRSTQWIDGSGKLRESASFKTGMEVRGIRVLAYGKDEMGDPQVKTQLNSKPISNRPDCKSPIANQLTVYHHLALEVTRAPHMSAKQLYQVQQIEQNLRVFLNAATNNTKLWKLSNRVPARNPYEQAMTGRGEQHIPMRLKLHFSPDIEDYVAARTFTIQWEMKDMLGNLVLISSQQNVTLDTQDPSLTPKALSPVVMAQLNAVSLMMTRSIENKLSCLPPKFQVLQVQANQFRVAGGQSSGIKVGDQMVVVNPDYVPARLFEPKALDKMVMAEVTAVSGFYAELKQTAGPKLSEVASYVAIPNLP